MEKMSKRKRLFIILSTYIILLTTPKIYAEVIPDTITYNSEYTTENNDYYASLNNKKIYIIKTDRNTFTPPDDNIYIIDERDNTDPNMSIIDSFKLNDKEIREVVSILLKYEEAYPSNWSRSYEAAIRECRFHRYGYSFNLETERTGQVDLNNNDEELYSSYRDIIKEIIDNIKPKTRTLEKDDN